MMFAPWEVYLDHVYTNH